MAKVGMTDFIEYINIQLDSADELIKSDLSDCSAASVHPPISPLVNLSRLIDLENYKS